VEISTSSMMLKLTLIEEEHTGAEEYIEQLQAQVRE
jgi:hypothetical protein